MGARQSSPPPIYELDKQGRWIDRRTGFLRRHYYDHYGMIRAQLVDKVHDGPLEFKIVTRKHDALLAEGEPLFKAGDPVFVLPTNWVGKWMSFAAKSDMQPGPVDTLSLFGKDGKLPYLAPGQDWRATTKWQFMFFVKSYGLKGPVLQFHAPKHSPPDDGSRLEVSSKGKGGGEGKGDDDGDDKRGDQNSGDGENSGAAPQSSAKKRGGHNNKLSKAAAKALSQPEWLKLVRTDKHCASLPLQSLAGALLNFITGLPYGCDNLGIVAPPRPAFSFMCTSTEVTSSSAHVLVVADARAAFQRKMGALHVPWCGAAFLEAGAKRSGKRLALERRKVNRQRKLDEQRAKAKALETRQRELEAVLDADHGQGGADKGGAEKGKAEAGDVGMHFHAHQNDGIEMTSVPAAPPPGRKRAGTVQIIGGVNPLLGNGEPETVNLWRNVAPTPPRVESNYGKEWMLLVACSLARDRWRKEYTLAFGSGGKRSSALLTACASTWLLTARKIAWRRAAAARLELPPPLAQGALHAAAVPLVQAAWRVGIAWRKLAHSKRDTRVSLQPAAACLLQLRWKLVSLALAKAKKRRELRAKQRELKLGKMASRCQRACRNATHARRAALARRQCTGQLQAFCAVKVQVKFRQLTKARLEAIVAEAAPEDEDDDEDDDDDAGDSSDDDDTERFYLFGREILAAEASARLVRMENERVQRMRVRNGEAEAHAARRMSEASTQATADAAATAAAAMALQQRTTVARPVGMTVVGAQRLPLIGAGEGGLGSGWTLETLQGSDMFLVVAALPQPLPPHVLVGHQQSDTAAEKQPAYVRRQQEAEEKERQQQLAQQGAAAAGGGGDAGSSSSSSEAAVQLAAAFSAPAQSVLRDANAPKIPKKAQPVAVSWKNCELDLSGPQFTGGTTLVFTLLRRPPQGRRLLSSSSKARDDFVGQATVRMSDLPDLWSAPPPPRHDASSADMKTMAKDRVPHELTLPLGPLRVRVWDGTGRNKLKLNHKAFACGQGATLTVKLAKQDGATLCNGWLHVASSGAPEGSATANGDSGGSTGTSLSKQSSSSMMLGRKSVLTEQTFAKRWVSLSHGRLAIYESGCGVEPDVELSLRSIHNCRMTGSGSSLRLIVRFDSIKAGADALRRGNSLAPTGAAGGTKAGSHGFATGPTDPKTSAAVAKAALDASSLTFAPSLSSSSTIDRSSRGGGASDDLEQLVRLQRALDKALFANGAN